MRINTNLAAVNTQRNLASVQGSLAKSVERLSSGLRINRAGDDAAGLTISEKLRGQVKGLNQAMRNAQDGISMIQTAEGGLNETHAILQRMRELAVQGANETLTDQDREAIGDELTSLKSEVDRIAKTTEFNTKKLLNGSLSTKQDTANSDINVGVTLNNSATISKIDLSGAKADKTNSTTYTASFANANVTLTDGDGNTSTVTIADMTAGNLTTQTLDFAEFGIKITLSGTGTGANLANALNGDDLVIAAGDSAATFQVGANSHVDQTVTLKVDSSESGDIGDATGAGGTATSLADAVLNFTTDKSTSAANDLMKSLDAAIADVSKSRSNLGAVQNRLEHTIENLSVSAENLTASESRIRDADMAAEMVSFTRSNVLQQAGTSILAQANQLSQGVLSLLR